MATNNNDKTLNVPHLRFPEFTGEWEKYKLSEMCSFFSGGTPSSSKKEYYDGNIPFIRSGELHDDQTELFITEDGLKNSAAKMVEVGDLLLALYGATSGDIAISKINGAINQAILCIRTEQSKKFIESIWYKHAGKLLQTYLQGGQGNLSADIVKNISFYFATIEEQKKLAKFISLLDERIATQNKIIEDLKKLRSAIRVKVFKQLENSCEHWTELGNMLQYEQPSKYLVSSTEYSDDYTIPVLTANKAFILGYTDENFGVYDKGECVIFDDFTMDVKFVNFPFKVKSSAIKILTSIGSNDLYFVYEYLQNLGLVSEEHKRHYISEIEPMNIAYPPLEEQQKISNLLRSFNNKIECANRELFLYNQQKQYLLTLMFI